MSAVVHQLLEPRYSVVVPVFESDRSVERLVERTIDVFENVVRHPFEIVLVDDGSLRVSTWPTLCELTELRPGVITAVRLTRNYGKSCAILCGLAHARGQWVVTIDDDLQQRPEDIPALLEHEDHDVVVANFEARHHDAVTVATSRLKSRFDRAILGLPCPMSPFKVIRAPIVRALLELRTAKPFIPAMLASVTNDFFPVVVRHEPSAHGRSRYTLIRRLAQFSDLLIGNSNLLLRGVGAFGALVAASGLLFAVYVVARRIFGSIQEPGWASLVAINLVFGGLTLITLGIVGEYLIRILEGSTGRPAFVVREVVGARHLTRETTARSRSAAD